MRDYRMSYVLTVGQPKEKDDLDPNEGLTDTLVFVSVLGEVGTDAPMSLQIHQLGPKGPEVRDSRLAYSIAAALLIAITDMKTELPEQFAVSARAALEMLRRPFIGDIGG